MMSFIRSRRAKVALATAAIATMLFAVSGCGQKQQQAPQGAQATLVKSMKVIKRDTPLVYEYTGFIEANREMELRAQVTGQITGKFFKGGDRVSSGQVLYTIDSRTYEANLINAKATYEMAAADAERYTTLYNQNAISKQVLDKAVTAREQARAALLNAQTNMSETSVRAPFDGRIDTASVEVGNYVTQGQTVLTKISDTNPVNTKFSVSEPEYLAITAANDGKAALDDLHLVLSDGTAYEGTGRIIEVNRGISNNTGTITVKAQFDNPNRRLLPGMFTHIKAVGGIKKDAILIPQRSIVEMLYKKFVFVVGPDKKVKMTEVTTGNIVDRLFIVESGLKGDETIVVEGTAKLRNDATVKEQVITEKDLDTTDKIEGKAK
ncbi:MAG: efflux RND transporter periplasmic adaptor subunit [Phascolarctobacterium sp.]|nr:efflux RND transporter periplasmic adaptor subunit [Phascolarctobacterium sp.]